MDQQEILSVLRAGLPEGALLDSGWDTLRFAVRSSFEFADFVAQLRDAADITPDVEQVAARISQGLRQHYDLGNVGDVAISAIDTDLAENADYANESIVAGAELFLDLRHLASQVVRNTRPMPLKWSVYPSVVELRMEFLVHFEKLRSPASTVQERIAALLHAARLQMTFLANTFC